MSGIVQTLRLNCPFLHLTLMFFPPPQFRASFVFNPSSYLHPSLFLAPAVTTQIFTKTHLCSLSSQYKAFVAVFQSPSCFPLFFTSVELLFPTLVDRKRLAWGSLAASDSVSRSFNQIRHFSRLPFVPFAKHPSPTNHQNGRDCFEWNDSGQPSISSAIGIRVYLSSPRSWSQAGRACLVEAYRRIAS